MCVEIHFTKQTKLAKLTNVYSRVSLRTRVVDPGFPVGGHQAIGVSTSDAGAFQ